MKIVLAFDSYKGAVSAVEACTSAAEGLARLEPKPEIIQCPLSDGGEGFAEALMLAAHGRALRKQITGPLMKKTTAEIILIDEGRTAVIESALACGLGLVPQTQRNPLHTTSYGLGEMLDAAIHTGVTRVVVGLGGSATNDAGIGMLSALGWQFLDVEGNPVLPTGAGLEAITRIIPGRTFPEIDIVAACDVTNPLFGPQGAAHCYAPQKGASPEVVDKLDQNLKHFAGVSAEFLGCDLSSLPGAGAAGGLGYALQAFLGARFEPGAKLAIALSRLETHLLGADCCLTGEGRTDFQTAFGKLPAAVAECCARAGIPCVGLPGALGDGWRELYQHGFTALFSLSQRPQRFRDALAATASALADAAEAVGRLLRH